MSAQLRETADALAGMLWREHTVYRDRSGVVVIRGEHVQRWISLSTGAGRDEVLLRAGRILEGGTTAPARSEAVAGLSAGTGELAAACRRLLAEVAAAPPAPTRAGGRRRSRTGRMRRGGSPVRHTGFRSWLLVVGAVGIVVVCSAGAGVLR
ncbi:hypothetical protein ACFWUZ_12840 [Streptomyces sp. NPDC058646]|uniref:hypothetical protein n=1 Tax=Streptomyces sp. NPDC058646 TaxID=3346574 RepID=UPI0036691003